MDPLMRLRRVFEVARVTMGRDCSEQSSTAMQKALIALFTGDGAIIGARQDLSDADVTALVRAARVMSETLVVFNECFVWEVGARSLLGRVVEHFTGIEVSWSQAVMNATLIINPGDGAVRVEWNQTYLGGIPLVERSRASEYLRVRPLAMVA